MRLPVYTDQSATGLRFQLFSGPVDATQFTIVCEETLEMCGISVRAGIIGASHFLSLTLPSGKMLNEVFACTEVVSDSPRVTAGPLGELEACTRSQLHHRTVTHTFVPRLVAWQDGAKELTMLQDLIAAAKRGEEIGLSFEFPSQHDNVRPPLTLVWVGRDHQCLVVKTAHCYPNEDNIVFTQSIITLQ